MSFRPLRDNLVIRRDASLDKLGKLHLPEQAKRQPFRGTVIAAGEGKPREDGKLMPMVVHVGDVVWFGNYGPTRIKLPRDDGTLEDLLVCPAEDVLAVGEGAEGIRGDRLLLKPIKPGDKTDKGLFVPESTRCKTLRGIVRGIGMGRRLPGGFFEPIDMREGSEVLYAPDCGTIVTIGDEELLIVAMDDVWGVVQG
jgi:chaperonin GroES